MLILGLEGLHVCHEDTAVYKVNSVLKSLLSTLTLYKK